LKPAGLLFLVLIWVKPGSAETLKIRMDGDRLRLTGDSIHFLTGHPLDRLHNGAVVTYVLQLTMRAERGGKILSRLAERFVFSYDLWEEKFSVTRLGMPARSASNLSRTGAESWCLDNLSMPAAQAPAGQTVWFSMEYQSEDAKDPAGTNDSPFTLSNLIDIFSRRPRDDQQVRGSVEIGPFRPDKLKER